MPVLSHAEGPVLSHAEGPVLSHAEGPVLSHAEGPVLSHVEANGADGAAVRRTLGIRYFITRNLQSLQTPLPVQHRQPSQPPAEEGRPIWFAVTANLGTFAATGGARIAVRCRVGLSLSLPSPTARPNPRHVEKNGGRHRRRGPTAAIH